jgi:hypothetical protein
MFHRASVARLEPAATVQPKAPTLWGFRRHSAVDAAAIPAPAEVDAFAPDAIPADFESFGRGGLQLGGLHRDQQWVGAWGGRC